MVSWLRYRITRRLLLGGAALLDPPSMAAFSKPTAARQLAAAGGAYADLHGGMTTVGEVDHDRNGFDPHEVLTDWDVRSDAPRGPTQTALANS